MSSAVRWLSKHVCIDELDVLFKRHIDRCVLHMKMNSILTRPNRKELMELNEAPLNGWK